ncbi:MAG: nitrate oxidoreductase subunit beta [Chloroflexi bacterium]|nr:nitrate oxidoreductase subunit beta [Chloroflexota bacterium]MDA1002463.1 nitrate oxidoreductase subunit beta [Chloroflexota bacterium]MQC27514.1 4Fe-4S dicluster domain-containing protein [Chloroflexota bacterium]
MAKVYNWQLGREMDYRFEQAAPDWQFAAIFNTNRCLACQTCTMACKSTWTFSEGQEDMWWNNVETKPYGGYPQHWDVKALDLIEQANPGGQSWGGSAGPEAPYGTYNGATIFDAARMAGTGQQAVGYIPTDEEWSAPNIHEDSPVAGAPLSEGAALPVHKTWFFYLQRICNHCSYPACLSACPRNAIYKREEDGIVLIDQSRCRGYRKCVEQCPYKKSMYRPDTRVSEKCIGCFPRVEGSDPLTNGLPMETRCMAVCPGQIRLQGLVPVEPDGSWKVDADNPLYYLVREEKMALPLYPQFGTQPNVFYVPPRWVPRPYLKQMFGPGVDDAIAAYERPSRRAQAVLQLFRVTQSIIFRFEVIEGPKVSEVNVNGRSLEVFDDTVIGYSRNGQEVVRVTVKEPFFERPVQFLNSI